MSAPPLRTAVAPAAASAAWQAVFTEYLPLVRSVARAAFRSLAPPEREDAVNDVVAQSAADFARLADRGKGDFWFLPAVARYAARRRAAGRPLVAAAKRGDALNPSARRAARVASLGSLRAGDATAWRAAVVDSRNTDPAEAAAFRVDFETWLSRLSERQRRAVAGFAEGDTTTELARRLGVSAGRVSQIRADLRASWLAFQGEPTAASVLCAGVTGTRRGLSGCASGGAYRGTPTSAPTEAPDADGENRPPEAAPVARGRRRCPAPAAGGRVRGGGRRRPGRESIRLGAGDGRFVRIICVRAWTGRRPASMGAARAAGPRRVPFRSRRARP